jgi:autotransporter-associated beta strand protein
LGASGASDGEFLAREPLRALLVAAALLVAVTRPAAAQDATWNLNGTGVYNTNGNWTPNAVPTGTASFGVSNQNAVTFSSIFTNIGGWTFNTGASAYTFDVASGQILAFNGAGIVVNAGSAAITNNGGIVQFHNTSTAGSAAIVTTGGGSQFVQFFDTSTAGSAAITNNNNGFLIFTDNSTAGSATIANTGIVSFTSASTAGSAAITTHGGGVSFDSTSTAGSAAIANNFGFVSFHSSSTAGGATIANNLGANLQFFDTSTAGNAAITNDTFVSFFNSSTAGNAAITNNAGVVDFFTTSTAGNAAITNNAGTVDFFNSSTAGNAAITNNAGVVDFFTTSTAGNAAITNTGSGTVDFSSSTGPNNDHKLSAGSIAGSGVFDLGANQLTVGGNNRSTIVSGLIADGGQGGGTGGSLVKVGLGVLTLSGTNTYTGATTVNAGVLDVDGSIASSSLTSVNAGGFLKGFGTIGNATINSGGAFDPGNGAPGTFTTVSGNLAFQSGARYAVFVDPSTAAFAKVTGQATLNGATVSAVFANGSYISKQYTILTANGGVNGVFAPAVVNFNLPANLRTTLSFDADNAYLNLVLAFALPGGLNGNQQNVGNALTNFFNTTGGIPMVYASLSSAGLSQAAGETATGSQQTTFDAMGLFMGLLTDPFMDRSGSGTGAGATPFAEETDATNAYAAVYRKAPVAAPFVPSWSVWAAGYGGSQTTDGNAVVGSNTATSRIAGTAVGADYRFSPSTIAGFALAGGGTNFAVNGFGSGRSDLFQAGAYLRHTQGAAYFSAALAYGWQDITTNRTVTIAGIDQLRAEFNANAYSGRVEGGYRFVTPWIGGIGLTPYAAGQFTTFDLPAYAEQAIVGSNNFALAYGAKDVTDSRSELGVRTDKSFAMTNSILTLRGRLAWAHDFNPDRNIGATFQALPGASFVVNGAAQAHDSALTTASAELKWTNGWSAAATFEGEFSAVTSSYAGKGVVRYAW